MKEERFRNKTYLRNVKQWLHSTKTRCDSLKSHMEYMKMLYHDIPQIEKTDKTVDNQDFQNVKTEISDNEITVSKQMDINDVSEEFRDVSCISTNDDDNNQKHESCSSSNLKNIISKINVQYKQDENVKSSNLQKETEVDLYADLPTTYDVPHNVQIESRPLSPIPKENMYREQNHILHCPYQKDLAQHSTKLVEDVSNSKKLFEQLILDTQNEHLLQELSSARNNFKLNISGSVKDGSLGRNKISSKIEKNSKSIPSAVSSKKGSSCKLDNIVSLKLKKRRRKIHCSNSKSTVTTRDTNFLGRKDAKRRKQKNNTNNNHSGKSQQTSNDVVEIYHNRAATGGSTCVISKKHSKLNRHMNYINVLSSVTNEQKSLNVKPRYEDGDYQCNYNIDENSQKNNSQKQYISKAEKEDRTNISDRNCDLEVSMTPSYAMEKCNLHQYEHSALQASYCGPLITHNYEMPTLASKLKRANRSYFSRFNFRNIPFVVGTSVTPSHNLGLNIQQVLSIMKTKQPTINGITPLLIRKVSKGMKPVSTLMEQMNEYSKLSRINSHVNGIHMQNKSLFINRDNNFLENESVSSKYDKKRLNANLKSPIKEYQNIREMIKGYANMYENYHKRKDTKSENQLNTISSTQILQTTDNAKILKLFASQQNIKLEKNVQDKQACNALSDDCNSSKGIREVLIHLHDQFEELNIKYEKLQAKTKGSNNKELEEEIVSLEKELNTKEDEINAVINLYKEVMVLKRQMKLLQEKNSYICISSEIPLQSKKTHSTMPFTLTKSDGINDRQKFYHKRGSSVISTREPTSIRLAGLLRQIQTFQRQLKLSS
ncbi:uncharacterized protein LOC100877114 isoform X2 [Megachile rotundata]|uniref:uncharacterized protein LOC100877114 isoform X2 n=1 Tax=Megachile rotundata TaxID=143995 RepID=UPI003FD4D248